MIIKTADLDTIRAAALHFGTPEMGRAVCRVVLALVANIDRLDTDRLETSQDILGHASRLAALEAAARPIDAIADLRVETLGLRGALEVATSERDQFAGTAARALRARDAAVAERNEARASLDRVLRESAEVRDRLAAQVAELESGCANHTAALVDMTAEIQRLKATPAPLDVERMAEAMAATNAHTATKFPPLGGDNTAFAAAVLARLSPSTLPSEAARPSQCAACGKDAGASVTGGDGMLRVPCCGVGTACHARAHRAIDALHGYDEASPATVAAAPASPTAPVGAGRTDAIDPDALRDHVLIRWPQIASRQYDTPYTWRRIIERIARKMDAAPSVSWVRDPVACTWSRTSGPFRLHAGKRWSASTLVEDGPGAISGVTVPGGWRVVARGPECDDIEANKSAADAWAASTLAAMARDEGAAPADASPFDGPPSNPEPVAWAAQMPDGTLLGGNGDDDIAAGADCASVEGSYGFAASRAVPVPLYDHPPPAVAAAPPACASVRDDVTAILDDPEVTAAEKLTLIRYRIDGEAPAQPPAVAAGATGGVTVGEALDHRVIEFHDGADWWQMTRDGASCRLWDDRPVDGVGGKWGDWHDEPTSKEDLPRLCRVVPVDADDDPDAPPSSRGPIPGARQGGGE